MYPRVPLTSQPSRLSKPLFNPLIICSRSLPRWAQGGNRGCGGRKRGRESFLGFGGVIEDGGKDMNSSKDSRPLFRPAIGVNGYRSIFSSARRAKESGRGDLNSRPLDPQSSALGQTALRPVKTVSVRPA